MPYRDLGTTEDSEILEIQVSAYVRKIRRKKYSGCGCQGKKGIITASPAPRVLPRNNLGVSVWTGGLQRLAPLFEPLVQALREKQLTECLFHADETGWKVFESIDVNATPKPQVFAEY